MPTLSQYVEQAKELKARAKGFEVPVFNTLIDVLGSASSVKLAAAELAKLGDESSRLLATRKFALAAQAIREKKELNAQSMQ
ncbi:MAG: hypothetical protein IT461_16215, partial [Planctomycetes bacterium]|nr:hypothetical protein [Planctomycetota bacterium]